MRACRCSSSIQQQEAAEAAEFEVVPDATFTESTHKVTAEQMRAILHWLQIKESGSAVIPEEDTTLGEFTGELLRSRSTGQWRTTMMKVTKMSEDESAEVKQRAEMFNITFAKYPFH